jgi:phage terminase large subunit-like protein
MDGGWSTSCPDWRTAPGRRRWFRTLPLFTEEAERAVRIFKRLKLPDVIGTPTMAEACGPWFFPIVAAIFGAYDPETNRRMIQEFFLLVPKKNGKSSLAAAMMVVAMIVNRRPAAEFLLIAPTKTVADISFRQAWGIIKLDAELTKLFHPQEHLRKITHRNSGAVLQIKAADTDVITGSKSTGILVDETHVFAEKSKAADIFVEIRGALAARPDGFMIQITTQSKKPPAGVFKSELMPRESARRPI